MIRIGEKSKGSGHHKDVRSDSYSLNYAAGDFGAGVAGGLGMKVVRTAVDDHGAAHNVRKTKTVREYGQIGFTAVGQQRGEVTGMVRVRRTGRVIVALRGGKAIADAAATLVDMQGEKAAFVVSGESGNVGGHQHTLRRLEKVNCAGQGGGGRRAAKPGRSLGVLVGWIHYIITSNQPMRERAAAEQSVAALRNCDYTALSCLPSSQE